MQRTFGHTALENKEHCLKIKVLFIFFLRGNLLFVLYRICLLGRSSRELGAGEIRGWRIPTEEGCQV
jgi:hypothetical protein